MSRTIIELNSKDNDANEKMIQKFLMESEFGQTTEKGETYWVNTKFPAHLCIKYTFNGNIIILEGWVKIFRIASFIKSVYSEKDLNGLEAKFPKKICKNVMKQIEARVI